jgi:HEAT repeats
MNGIHALRGFDYQATVILNRLLDHFEKHGRTAYVRPEDIDDLGLSWTENNIECRRYEQIKKPREDEAGNRNPDPGTLSRIANELLPNTITHLLGNRYEQVWILGDDVHKDVDALIKGGQDAAIAATASYWDVVHRLARTAAVDTTTGPPRKSLLQWKIPGDLPPNPSDAFARVAREFAELVSKVGCGADVAGLYQTKLDEIHRCLPDILARIQILSTYGSEREIAESVQDRLEKQYSLPRSVIEDTLFRNLRGFINDVSKQPGRKFGQEEFEVEVRCVWPQMIPIREPPQLTQTHVRRPDLVERFTTRWSGSALAVLGISGSGKTSLAAEVMENSRSFDPDRIVYYAEVRPETRIRDVLAGVGFHLRRIGIDDPFLVSIETGPSEDAVLSGLARSYSTVPKELLVLIDLVEGTCSDAFARDLAVFIRNLSSTGCRVAVLGQENALRGLTALERDAHRVSQLDIRGFNFDEFVTIATFHHLDADRRLLWDIYHRVTAGSGTGLSAQLAQTLAAAESMEEMSGMAARPPEDILPYAEQRRFARISERSKSAAEKLICFVLPFKREDAQEIFPNDNIGSAIGELLQQGLLRSRQDGSFEMHETVRAGLEGAVAVEVRRSAHRVLAGWYGRQELVTAEILHLDEAGQHDTAIERARVTFLSGRDWSALSAYVTRNKLVSAREVIGVAAGSEPTSDIYLLSSILRDLGNPVPIDDLLRIMREQTGRFYADYQWQLALVESVLEFEPNRLHDLIGFYIETSGDFARTESALGWLLIASRRKKGVIESRTAQYFKNQRPEIKKLLVSLMLTAHHRDVLRPILEFIASEQEPVDDRRRPAASLSIDSRDEAVEFLAALPEADPAAMLLAKSPLLGRLAEFVWSQRKILRTHCLEIVRDDSTEVRVMAAAIRILIFLGEPTISAVCDPLSNRKDVVGKIATMVPVILPTLCDLSHYERRVFDTELKLEDRASALIVCASTGLDLGAIYRRLREVEGQPEIEKWNPIFITLCVQAPFPDAIPLFEKQLRPSDDSNATTKIAILTKLGELPVPEATGMLVRALSHGDRAIRLCVCLSLARRRSRAALPNLKDQYEQENDEAVAVSMASAIVASGAGSVADLDHGRHSSPSIALWKCILATRTRDVAAADFVVEIACDPRRNWQLRRAAIFAAARLPYGLALEKIVPRVMAERSPLDLDRSENLYCHSILTSILLPDAQGMLQIFVQGKARFVEFFGEIFDEFWKSATESQGLPTGTATARWLFKRLRHHGWPTNKSVPDIVLNELHVPIVQSAVLRSLRLSKRPDIIEGQLARAHHVWIAVKCLLERRRAGDRDQDFASRMRSLVEASPCKGEPLLDRIIAVKMSGGRAQAEVAPPPPTVGAKPVEPSNTHVSYADLVSALSGSSVSFNIQRPLILETMQPEQFDTLVRLAAPVNDRHQSTETYLPSVSFTTTGRLVARRRVSTVGEPIAAIIRPAVAAANRFGSAIPWHEELLSGAFANTYVPRLLACLAEQGDGGRLFEEFNQHADAFLPHIGKATLQPSFLALLDERIVPFLSRYVSSGTDALFETLCILSLRVNIPAIDPILSGLFHRWIKRFDLSAYYIQQDQNHELWRGFSRLAEHPRFSLIDSWASHLTSVLQANLSWFRKQTIARVLERDPKSYIQIEALLLREANWQHFLQDEIDRLDAAAEDLFSQFLEE